MIWDDNKQINYSEAAVNYTNPEETSLLTCAREKNCQPDTPSFSQSRKAEKKNAFAGTKKKGEQFNYGTSRVVNCPAFVLYVV